MKYDIKAPRKQKGKPHKDARDFCSKLTITAQDELDEIIVAVLADAIAYKNRPEFKDWLQSRVESQLNRLKLRIA